MRLAIMCLALSGCSLIVDPNPRHLLVDGGPEMGDAGPIMPDTGMMPDVDGGADSGGPVACGDFVCGPGFECVRGMCQLPQPDSGMPACGMFQVDEHYAPTSNTCGLLVSYLRPTTVSCSTHTLSGMLHLAGCDSADQVVTPDGVDFMCDSTGFHCTTNMTPDFHLTVDCTYGGGGSCSVGF